MPIDLAADAAAILAVMRSTRPERGGGSWASYRLAMMAWPDHPATLTPRRQRAARALRCLRRQGLVECLSTNGLWRLVESEA